MNHRYRYRSGLTLIELMVAVSILVVLILGIGYMFTKTSSAVGRTEATLQTEATARGIAGAMREDFSQLTKDGFLAIVEGTATTPPALIFTKLGPANSMTMVNGANQPVSTNVSLVAYLLQEDEMHGASAYNNLGTDPGTPWVFCRSSTLLHWVGSSAGGFVQQTQLPDVTMDSATLGQMRYLPQSAPYPTPSIELWLGQMVHYMFPMHTAPARLAASPYEADPLKLGVRDLWRYLAAGVVDMKVEFFDSTWRDVGNPPASYTGAQGIEMGTLATGADYIVWRYNAGDEWPEALRVRLRVQDVSQRGPLPAETDPTQDAYWNYEIILNLRP